MEALDKVKQIANKAADKLGLKVYNVYFEGGDSNKILHIEVDKKGGVSLKEVADFTDLVNPEIDLVEWLDFPYSLDCSSLGAERFISNDEIDEHLHEYMEITSSSKKVLGTLEEVNEEEVVIKSFIKGRPHKDKLKKSDISKVQLRIKF